MISDVHCPWCGSIMEEFAIEVSNYVDHRRVDLWWARLKCENCKAFAPLIENADREEAIRTAREAAANYKTRR